jgi:hypothetical protein
MSNQINAMVTVILFFLLSSCSGRKEYKENVSIIDGGHYQAIFYLIEY